MADAFPVEASGALVAAALVFHQHIADPRPRPVPVPPVAPASAIKPNRSRKPTLGGLLPPSQAADRLNVTVEQLFAFVRDGELRYVNVGRGSKRPRYAFTDADIQELIDKRKTREVPCPCTSPKSPRRISGTTSRSLVVGFTARRAQQLAAKRKQ